MASRCDFDRHQPYCAGLRGRIGSDCAVAKMSAILNLTEPKAKYSAVVERVSRSEEIIVAPLATMDVQRHALDM